jgi:hypothetical protein
MQETEDIKDATVIDSEYYYEDLEGDKEEIKKEFYRTKDKYVASYLRARGYTLRGIEKININKNKSKKIIVFCFDGKNVVRRPVIEYYGEKSAANVNAQSLVIELRNINSLIANF